MQIGVQRSFNAHGIKGECGHVTFDAGSPIVLVPTALKTIFMGMGQMQTGEQLSQLICTCSNKVVDGKVEFKRHGGYLGDAPTLNYILFGWG